MNGLALLSWLSRTVKVTIEDHGDGGRTTRYEVPAVLWPVTPVESRVVLDVPLGEPVGERVGDPLGEQVVFADA